MTLFRRLAIASTVATFLLMTVGGLVRATKSGLGCGTNWPHCPGDLTRALVIELSHRATAGVVIVLIAATAFAARRYHRGNKALTVPATVALGLVLFQALLGAVVVWLELRAISVVLHLGTALTLLALLIYLSVAAAALESGSAMARDDGATRTGVRLALTVGLLLLVGSYVTGSGAGNVFPDWPLMNGALVPDLSVNSFAVHFAHRLIAALAGIGLAAAVFALRRRRAEVPVQYRLSLVAAGLFAVEIGIGALNVWTNLNAYWVTAHLAVAVAIFATVVTLTLVSHPAMADLRERSERRRVGRLVEAM